jgi:hypothetical protein
MKPLACKQTITRERVGNSLAPYNNDGKQQQQQQQQQAATQRQIRRHATHFVLSVTCQGEKDE